jgi:hypothetical protein
MTTRRLAVLLFVCLAPLSAPSTASAGWLGWLEQMSGPGPFKSKLALFGTVYCHQPKQSELHTLFGIGGSICDSSKRSVDFYVDLEYEQWDAGVRKEWTNRVELRSYHAVIYKPLRSVFCAKCGTSIVNGLDAGIGVGWYRFTGAQPFIKKTASVPLRLRVTPTNMIPTKCFRSDRTRQALSAFYAVVGLDIMPGSVDFPKPDGSVATFGPEDMRNVTMVVDVGKLAKLFVFDPIFTKAKHKP